MRLKHILTATSLVTLVSACGGSSGSDSPGVKQPELPQIPSDGGPGGSEEPVVLVVTESYELSDPSCNVTSAPATLGPIRYSEIAAAGLLTDVQPTDVPGLGNSQRGVRTDNITTVSFGKKFYGEFDIRLDPTTRLPEEIGEDDSYGIVSEGQRLYLCKDSYKQESLESQTLAVLHHVEAAATYYSNHAEAAALPRIEITMFPEFKKKWTMVNHADFSEELHLPREFIVYESDNAFYGSNIDGFDDPVIAVFPRGYNPRKPDRPQPGTQLWLSPFVLAHEYGHHAFGELFLGEISEENALKYLKPNPFGNRIVASKSFSSEFESSMQSSGIDLLRSERRNFRADEADVDLIIAIIAGFNEAYADVFGYLVNERRPGLASILGEDLEYRNIEASRLAGGLDKVVDRQVLKAIAFGNSLLDNDFSDEHVSGTVFAHIISKMLDLAVTPENDQSLKILNKWVADFAAKIGDDLEVGDPIRLSSDLVGLVFESFVEAYQQGGELSLEQCEALDSYLPAIARLQTLAGSTSLVIRDSAFDCVASAG